MRSTIFHQILNRRPSVLILVSIIAMTACSEKPEIEPVDFLISPQTSELSFTAAYPESYTYEVNTNAETWDAQSDTDWLVVERTSDNQFTVKAKPNVAFEPRSGAKVTVTAGDSTFFEITATQAELNIYIGGCESTPEYMDYATYWHNTEKHILETGGSSVLGIYVTKEKEIHLVGRGMNVFNSYGFYWSESNGEHLTNTHDGGSGSASGIFVDEETNDIYYTSYEMYTDPETGQNTSDATLWKNFEPFVESEVYEVYDVLVQDGKVYVLYDGYYKVDDEVVELEPSGQYLEAASMVIHNGDVYVGGFTGEDNFNATYWVNGKVNPIPSTVTTQAYAISVDSNGDVYLCGSEGSGLSRRAVYWKNGEMVPITEVANACASGIFALDGNLIYAYFTKNDAGISTIYCNINGETIDITDGTMDSFSEDLFVL